jgi:c-di-GMP-binding flagellar brake protein YcgR
MVDQYTEIITGDKTIIGTLRSLIDSHVVCKMEIPRTKHNWITVLLDIEEGDRSSYLLIDRVAGFENTLSRYPDREISLEFRDKGSVPCLFNTKVLASRPTDILSEIPKVIYRIQRRQYFRIEAHLGTEITFLVEASEDQRKATVRNFSAGGAAFYTERALNLNVGDQLKNVYLNIPEGSGWTYFHIPVASVRRIEQETSYSVKVLCAVEFTDVAKETRDRLTSHIFKEQRVVIQKLRK